MYCNVFFAQNKLPVWLKFNSLTVENGLANNTINDIVQDSLGFVWIATNDGLSRYDGKSFVNFTESLSGKNSITNNYVKSLQVDPNGMLWVLTDDGLNKYNSRLAKFEFIGNNETDGLSHQSTTAIAFLNEETTLIGSYGGGVDVLENQKVVKRFNPTNSNLGSNLISSIKRLSNNEAWITTWYDGLFKLNYKTNEVEKINLNLNTNEELVIYNSYADSSDLYLATNHGFSIINSATLKTIHINQATNKSLKDSDILSVFKDRQDNIWLGSRNNGAFKINKQKLVKAPFTSHFENYSPNSTFTSINHRSVSCFFQDSQNNIWLGTHNRGINVVNPDGENLRSINKFPNLSSNVNMSIWGLIEDDNNNIWLGTDGSGLIKYNPFTQKSKHYINQKHNKNSLSDNAILSATKDKEGNLWFGTYAGGLNKFDFKKKKFYRYYAGNDATDLNRNDIRALHVDKSNNLWIGSNGGGLHLYQKKTDNFKFISNLGWIDIRCITSDQNGLLWIGTFGNGLFSYDQKNQSLVQHKQIDKYDANIIFSLAFSDKENLWIGTRYKGLIRYNTRSKKTEQYSTSNGLSNNTVQKVLTTNNNEIWLTTNEGIDVFNIKESKFKNFNPSQGVLSGPFNNNSGILTSNGYLFFGSNTGLNMFDPEKLLQDKAELPIIFTDLKLFNKSISVEDPEHPILQESILFTNEIELNYNENVLTLEFAALNFPKGSDVKYLHRLTNFEDNWNEASSQSTVTYRNLPPGDYIFEVKTLGNDYLNSKIKSLKITVKPHFLLTWQAILVYLLIVILFIWGVSKYLLERAKLRNTLHFEKQLRQQEKELNQERFRFFTNFSHELRTPLTLIFGPVNDLLSSEKNPTILSKLDIVKRNSSILLDLINKMLEFRKTETQHNKLEVGRYNIQEFLNEITNNFIFYAQQKEIDFEVKNKHSIELWFDSKKIQNVILNLLSNAFKYTPKGGKITIEVINHTNSILIKFKDTGVGIDSKSIESVFDLYYHKDSDISTDGTGIGLALCKKLMDLHRFPINVESKIGEGSCFSIELFKNKNHFNNIENIEFLSTHTFKIKKPFINQLQTPIPQNKSKISNDDLVVLVVDDNPDILTYVKDILEIKYKVIVANDGKEGIDKAKQYLPDIVISDVMMPKKSGVDLCKELKTHELTSHIPIILLTAKLGDKDKLQGMQIGADDYITKPFYSDFLLTRIENIFKNRSRLVEFYKKRGNVKGVKVLENKEDKFLKKLNKLIIDKCTDPNFSVIELCAELGYSRSSLYRKLKAITGHSINLYIRKTKLQKAYELLQTHNFRVSEVAYMCGYNDVNKFRTYFKEEYKVLPSKVTKSSVDL